MTDTQRARGVVSAAGNTPEYNDRQLRIYDMLVVRASNLLLWRCAPRHLQAQYNALVGPRHLEIGPGTGYFLDHCRFPVRHPDLTLLDVNPDPLRFSARRLARYAPQVVQADISQPLPQVGSPFSSVAMGYVLHCLAASPEEKQRALGNVAAVLAPDGVLFGSSVLAHGVAHTPLSRAVGQAYQKKAIFHNADDSLSMLSDALKRHFSQHWVTVRGSVALFAARSPLPASPVPENAD